MIYYEYRPTVKRVGAPKLITSEEVAKVRGFVSVYGFDEEGKRYVEDSKGTFGIQGHTLYSNLLYIDIDNNDELAEYIRADLEKRNVTFSMYYTGGRGFHFHIPIVPMWGTAIHYKQKVWVGYLYPGADCSLYKSTGIIRTPGTFHSKNPGEFKRLVHTFQGDVLEIDTSNLPLPLETELTTQDGEEMDRENMLDHLLSKAICDGGRNTGIYKRAFICKQAGFDRDKTTRILRAYNAALVHPRLPDYELTRTIGSAYRGK